MTPTLHAARCATGNQDRQVYVIVQVRISHPAAVQVKRVIQQRLQNALANEILAGNFPEGCKIHVDTQRDGFVFTTTTWTVFPATEGPDLPIELDTMTAMYCGTDAGGFELLPGRVDQLLSHDGGFVVVVSAKPLKLAGAEPPLTVLVFDHCALQKVTAEPTAALPSPITNEPEASFVNDTGHGAAGCEVNHGDGRTANDGQAEHEARDARDRLDGQRPHRLEHVLQRDRAGPRADPDDQHEAV